MVEQKYFTVGELAHRVGVTVRTIQYYDQQGLVSPSAKGANNQRLYTEDNVKDLYRILTLKYMGLSLSDIKNNSKAYENPDSLKSLANAQIDAIEEEFQALLRRLSTLRNVHELASKDDVDWETVAATIQESQGESQFFWHLTGIRDDSCMDDGNEGLPRRSKTVSSWHGLIAEVIQLMASGEALTSPRNKELAERYLALSSGDNQILPEESFILMENFAFQGERDGCGSFDELRQAVFGYLDSVVAANRPQVN